MPTEFRLLFVKVFSVIETLKNNVQGRGRYLKVKRYKGERELSGVVCNR